MHRLRNKIYNLLRKSEVFFKTDMVYLAKGTFWLSAGQAFSSVATFLLAIAFAHFVSKETYGTYKYVLAMVGMLAAMNLRGMAAAVTQAVARGHEGVLIPALREKIMWGSLGGIASFILGTYYYLNGNLTLTISFWLIAIFIPIFDSFEIYDAYLQGKKLFNISAIYGTTGQIVSTVMLIGVLYITNNLYILLFTYFATLIATRLITFLYTLKKFPPNTSNDNHALVYGRHSSFIDMLATILSSLDSPMLFHYLGAAEVAVYTFAMAPSGQMIGLIKRIPTLATPKLAERSAEKIDPMLKKRMMWLFLLGLAIAGIYSLFAEYFFYWFFPQYLDAVWYSKIFALSIPLAMAQSIISPALSAKLTLIPKKMLYLWNIPGVVGTVVLFLFIGKFGIIGAIMSRISASLATFFIGLFIWRRIKSEERRLAAIGQ